MCRYGKYNLVRKRDNKNIMNIGGLFIIALLKSHLNTINAENVPDKISSGDTSDARRDLKKSHRLRNKNDDRALKLLTTTAESRAPALKHIDFFKNLAHFDDADVRGPKWYNVADTKSASRSSGASKEDDNLTLSISSDDSELKKKASAERSSKETKEDKRRKQRHRVCHACPEDMLKRYLNLGIKWICAGYHRARRSFKSVCMMRFRNCQDGTLFVKLYDLRCNDDSYHGKHFFYQYPV